MGITWNVTNNVLDQVADQIRSTASAVLAGAGDVFHDTAYSECPVSERNDPGYVHLRDTIGYMVDLYTTYFQQWVTFYAVKDYAEFINNGTSRMAPRPFFTDGVLAVEDKIDDVIRSKFSSLILGRAEIRL